MSPSKTKKQKHSFMVESSVAQLKELMCFIHSEYKLVLTTVLYPPENYLMILNFNYLSNRYDFILFPIEIFKRLYEK